MTTDPLPGLTADVPRDTALALVGCGSAKQDHPAPARDLYTSSYFTLKKRYASLCGDWYILSAHHGLLNPDRHIAPYELELGDLTTQEREKWTRDVYQQLAPRLEDVTDVILLAGEDYRTPVQDALQNDPVTVHSPFDDLGGLFGQQRWLSDHAPDEVAP